MTPQEIKQIWPFEVEPREVQLEALAASWGKPGFAFFMRQRLGKTWTAFAEYSILREQGKVDWFVVICPNSIKQQWKEAIESVNPFIPVSVYNSYYKKKTTDYFKHNKRGGVFIINYESMQSFMDDFLSTDNVCFDTSRTYLVADESTKIKEPSAKMTKACHALSNLCSIQRVLTGKPTANSNADVWSQLRFIGATELSYYQHKHYYVVLGGYLGRQVVKNVNTEVLQAKMRPYVYIAPDKYIKGFEKIYEPMRRVNLTGDLQSQYKQMEDDLVLSLSSDVKITAPIVLTRYLRLQQISSGVAGDMNGVQHNLVDPFHNPRIKVVREILDNEITNKVIIPCRFRLSIENLEKVLTHDGHKISKLIGGMSPEEIENQKRLFNEGENNVLLAQLQVLSYGHTLSGSDKTPCDSMIFYENDFSLLNRSQSESRPEKMGRDIAISYYDVYASKMDRYLITALIKKEDASLALMGYSKQHGIRIGQDRQDDLF
jgi:SNF2 family DNA or RNA helicase